MKNSLEIFQSQFPVGEISQLNLSMKNSFAKDILILFEIMLYILYKARWGLTDFKQSRGGTYWREGCLINFLKTCNS